jgi:hypothetical protein
MDLPTHASIVTIRIAALIVLAATVAALWNFMIWLPWQVDCAIAGASAFAYAYAFEREETNEPLRRG